MIYKLLNDEAKAWWYFKKLREDGRIDEARELERKHIQSLVQHLKQAEFIRVPEAGRWVLQLGPYHTVSGYGDRIPQVARLIGLREMKA
jgi:hypothetical protein